MKKAVSEAFRGQRSLLPQLESGSVTGFGPGPWSLRR